ncbi:MAG: dihydroorotase family protein, partial [Actinomycetota bacterium]|nr:dihydroorotase family protein [Actinomycetota bacterium]
DVSGLIILPGMVDTHVHLMDPGDTEREDFIHGTRAAAARGVTTIVEHTHTHPIRNAPDLEEKKAHLRTRSNVDFGLAAHVWPDRIPEIGPLVTAGITFFKIFTCTTHGVPGLEHSQLSGALAAIKQAGGRCLIHNEDEQLTSDAERRLKELGRTDPGLLLEWRTRDAELTATAATAAAVLDSGVAATFAHVSSVEVLDVIDAFRRRGADVAAEACPQYLALGEDEVIDKGALRKFTPPARIRDESERSAMWDAVVEGRFSHFSTDHAPSTVEQKVSGDFWSAPFGLPGLDTTLPFLLDAALTGRIELHELAMLYATAPAARYRLSKGVLARGADADLVLVDPTGSWTVRDGDIISKAGWSPFSGKTLRGRVVATYLRGVEVARDGRCHDLRTGRFIRPSGN